eukprot:2033659-Rhodomonas_salina.1
MKSFRRGPIQRGPLGGTFRPTAFWLLPSKRTRGTQEEVHAYVGILSSAGHGALPFDQPELQRTTLGYPGYRQQYR